MEKIKLGLIACFCFITLLLFSAQLYHGSKESYQISKDCRGYNVEVETLELWKEKITTQKLKVLGFSGWSIGGYGLIECVDLNKSMNASIIKIYGTPEYIFKKNIIAGSMGFEIPDNDCIISDTLAQALFGSSYVENEKVRLDGKIYSITGVIKNKNPFICLSLKEGKVEYVEIILENRKNADEVVNALLDYGKFTSCM